MPFSAAGLRDALRPEPVEEWRWLLRVDADNPPPGSNLPVRWISDTIPLTNTEGEWLPAAGIEVEFVSHEEGRPPRARMRVHNVPELMQELLSFQESLIIDLILIIRSEPDHYQKEVRNGYLSNVEFDSLEITGVVGLHELFDAAFPKLIFSPTTTPNVFGRVSVGG